MTSTTQFFAAGLSAFSFCALNCQALANPLASSSFVKASGFTTSSFYNTAHNVQLLVDIKTGLELGQIRTLIPSAKVLEKSGKVYVLVSQTEKALTAYNLGKSLQDKFNLTFNLAYSNGHPDLNLAWMDSISTSIASNYTSPQLPKNSTSQDKLISSALSKTSKLNKQTYIDKTISEVISKKPKEALSTISVSKNSEEVYHSSNIVNNVSANETPLQLSPSSIVIQNNNLENNTSQLPSQLSHKNARFTDSSSSLNVKPNFKIAQFDNNNNATTVDDALPAFPKVASTKTLTTTPLPNEFQSTKRKSISETLKELRSISFSEASSDKIILAENSNNVESYSEIDSVRPETNELSASVASSPLLISENSLKADDQPISRSEGIAKIRESLKSISSISKDQTNKASLLVDKTPQISPQVESDQFKLSDSEFVEVSKAGYEEQVATDNLGKVDFSAQPLLTENLKSTKPQVISRTEGIAKIRESLKSLSSISNDQPDKVDSTIDEKIATSSLIKSVAIRPTHIGSLPVYSSRFTAVNRELAYVYVEVKNESDVSDVKRFKGVYGLQVRGSKLLARVGVYTKSKLGKRLLNQKLKKLEEKGLKIELALNYNQTSRYS
jgi:hypothetical protein